MTEPTNRESSSFRPIESELESRATAQLRASDIAKLAELDPERRRVGEILRDPFVILLLLVLLIVGAIFFVPRFMWRIMPEPAGRLVLVD